MGVEKRVLRHRCDKKGGCVERTKGSGSSIRAQPRKGAPSPGCGSVCVRRKGDHRSLSVFVSFDTCHIQGVSAPSCSSKILFGINTFLCFSDTSLSLKCAIPPPCLSSSIANTFPLHPYFLHLFFLILLFFMALCLFQALFFKSILAHSLTKSHANRSTCVCVCVCV